MTSDHVQHPAFAENDALGLGAVHHELLGRREEQRRLTALLHGAREGRAGVLVLRGEAGIGKSALLSDLANNAEGFCLCRAGGVESEMELAYAGLQQLCRPLSGHNVELTTLHRNVLDQVFGLTEGAPPERFLVGIAALDLVATVAQKQPIIWLVDDAQWIDRASMQAIAFVGRRLLAERVLILIATRDVSDENELAGLPELGLGGLNTEDAGRLFDLVVSGPTDPLVRDRIISETRGNPLALLELPRAWTTAELVEGLSDAAGIPLTGRLESAFAKRARARDDEATGANDLPRLLGRSPAHHGGASRSPRREPTPFGAHPEVCRGRQPQADGLPGGLPHVAIHDACLVAVLARTPRRARDDSSPLPVSVPVRSPRNAGRCIPCC